MFIAANHHGVKLINFHNTKIHSFRKGQEMHSLYSPANYDISNSSGLQELYIAASKSYKQVNGSKLAMLKIME
jgi:hypothetical protein